MTMEPVASGEAFDWKKVLLSFEGRTRRSHFWIGWLICLGLGVVLGWIPILGLLLSLALIWPNLAITVKRLHDMGHTGWLAAIPFVLGLVGGVVGAMMVGTGVFMNQAAFENEDAAVIMSTIAPALGIFGLIGLVSLGFLLWIGLTDSKPGPNKYGPNPKGL
ncbi:hypothetical protein ASG17_13795 [Brevundimonas sp. Leaf363]|uniref:DUF805 domain-containing protein n=1 Tax=Brevundimonas sp. Leaf363 TaxID=1736353 RepID=UPI0006FD4C86|nr:DUF805 domain-containing protein [Brevundimonas sp. Leaf363]KQS54017.1 hypothetical protein ASG17_13795 [Brevundimonas sp. Leaf363]